MNTIIAGNRTVIPTKIVCVGRNYVDHIKELNNEVPDDMVMFLKPNSSITNKLHSYHQEPLHYEAEICFLYEDGRFSAVGFGLDLTKRQLQNKLKSSGLPWERAKAFDGSALFSEFVEIESVNDNLSLQLSIDGKVVQSGKIEFMIYKPDAILSELLKFMSLKDGDIVMTGTPKGVGVILPGQRYTGNIMENENTIVGAEWIAC